MGIHAIVFLIFGYENRFCQIRAHTADFYEINTYDFSVGKHKINVKGVQTEVDARYEGKEQVVLIEAKNTKANNVIIRQLYYPYRQWQSHTPKKVVPIFFENKGDTYSIWQFGFENPKDYNSIKLVKSGKFKIVEKQ